MNCCISHNTFTYPRRHCQPCRSQQSFFCTAVPTTPAPQASSAVLKSFDFPVDNHLNLRCTGSTLPLSAGVDWLRDILLDTLSLKGRNVLKVMRSDAVVPSSQAEYGLGKVQGYQAGQGGGMAKLLFFNANAVQPGQVHPGTLAAWFEPKSLELPNHLESNEVQLRSVEDCSIPSAPRISISDGLARRKSFTTTYRKTSRMHWRICFCTQIYRVCLIVFCFNSTPTEIYTSLTTPITNQA